jgi:hypothetical protein
MRKEALFTARRPPKCFDRFSTTIIKTRHKN